MIPQMSIPIGWNQVKLGDISAEVMYGMNSSAIKYDGKHKYIRINDIDESTHKFSPKPLTSPSGNTEEKYKLKSGDILLARTGASVGKSYLYNEKDGDVYFAGFLIKFFINKACSTFVYYQTLISTYDSWVKSISVRSGQPGINAEEYKLFKLPLPPLPEQEKIVEVLETWDGYIGELTKAIRLKKKFKKGLAEKLLTGKLRLPGFNGEWTTVKLGEVCKVIMGQSPSSSAYNICEEGLPLIQGNNDIKLRKTVSRIWTSEITKTAEANCIILTVRAPVGCVGISQTKICLGRGVCAIEPINSDKNFIFSFLIYFEPRWKSLEQGSTFSAVNSSDIRNLEFLIPKLIEEQTAIAQILTTADQEIEALEKKKELIEDQKKFLLNNLITGRIRLPEFTA